MEEEITQMDSAVQANRVLQEIAVAGHYRASSFMDGFVIYSRDIDKRREEVTIQKISNRKFRVYRRIISTGE